MTLGEICRSCRLDGCILAGMNPRSIRVQQTNSKQMDLAIEFIERRKIELHSELAEIDKDSTSSNSGGITVLTY
jgi:hypothetical protein